MAGRTVLVLIDGTSCKFSTNTNIRRIFDTFDNSPNCRCLYHPGIGTNSYLNRFQTFIAAEIKAEAAFLYMRLADLDLDDDDTLIILGYSRGAIIARMLAQCITTEAAIRSMIDIADVPSGIKKMKVDFLGLFDPVIGWPFLFNRAAYDHNAYLNEHISNYVEIIAGDEGFVIFPLDSPTVKKPRRPQPKGPKQYAPVVRVSSKTDLEHKDTALVGVRKHLVMPGLHGEVGGQSDALKVAYHSLLAMLSQLIGRVPHLRSLASDRKLNEFVASVELEDPPHVGANAGLGRKILRNRRRIRSVDDVVVHELMDDFDGEKVSNHKLFGSWRPYTVPKELETANRVMWQDIKDQLGL